MPALARVIPVVLLALALTTSPIAAATPAAIDTTATPASPPSLADRAGLESWLDATMADQLERHHVPGATVVVVRDGEIALAKGYGYADLDARRPVVANETVFSVGSTGKLVTWTAVMQGVEDGRLDRSRDVNDYLTDSPVTVPATYPDPVTLEHLGTHTAGFEDSFAGMLAPDPSAVRPLGETLAANRPARVRPPGEFVGYSNYGTALAGHVLAERYDTTFTQYTRRNVFDPLGMHDTTYAQPLPARLEPRRAVGYAYANGDYQPQEPLVWTMPPEGGSLRTTGTDMARFMLAHLNGGAYADARILEPESVADMQRRHFARSERVPELNGMAYGFIEMDRNGERIVGHWGDTPHFKSLLALYPGRDTGLFVAYNAPGGDPARFALLDAFTDRYYPRSDAPVTPAPGAAERAAALAGDYRSLTVAETSWHRLLGVLTRTYTVDATPDGRLRTSRPGTPAETWVERRPGVYEAVGSDALLVFRFDDAGRPTHLFFGAFAPATYERVPWYDALAVTQGVIGGGVLAFAASLLFWAAALGYRAVRRRATPTDGPADDRAVRERLARGVLAGTALVWVAVVAVFFRAWLDFNAEVASPSLALRVGLVLPYVGLLGTLTAVAATPVVWRDGYWTRPHRVHYTVLALLAVLVTWKLHALHVLAL